MPSNPTINLSTSFNFETYYNKHIQIQNNNINIPIGILPGYNSKIDSGFKFTEDLIHNFTFIDLAPVSYYLSFTEKFLEIFTNTDISADYKLIKSNLRNFALDVNNLYKYNSKANNTVQTLISESLEISLPNLFKNLDIKNKKTIFRFIGSQDSVFSETLQNRFGDNNILENISQYTSVSNMVKSTLLKMQGSDSKKAKVLGAGAAGILNVVQNLPKFNYAGGLQLMQSISSSSDIKSLLFKDFLGLQVSLPRVFQSSSYQDSLNVFIKLTSPTGAEEDIRTYILTPLIMLMIISAPFSFDGLTYGLPPIFEINSYGNTKQSVGVIDVITITRGSMETTYNDKFNPLSIDVRLTLSSLNHHFANIILNDSKMKNKNSSSTLYKKIGVGLTNNINTVKTFMDNKPVTQQTIKL